MSETLNKDFICPKCNKYINYRYFNVENTSSSMDFFGHCPSCKTLLHVTSYIKYDVEIAKK